MNNWPTLKNLILFSLPIIAGQIGQMLFGIGDIVVAGRYSTEVVAALGVAGGIFAPFMLIGLGVTFAVSPLTSQRRGANQKETGFLSSSLLVSTLIALVLMGALFLFTSFISVLNLNPKIEGMVVEYLTICSPSLIPVLLFQVMKEFLQAHEDTYVANGVILFFNVLNVAFNIVFMFGLMGFPEMGIVGAAIATVLGRTLMSVTLLIYTLKKHTINWDYQAKHARELLGLGVPIALSILVEVMVFSTITVLIGKMDVLTSAAHNIVLHLASLTFMVPLGLSSACSVKVALPFGRQDFQELHRFAMAGQTIAISFMCFTGLSYYFFPDVFLGLATNDAAVIEVATGLIFFVALFQLSDGIQVTFMGILRGMGITKTPMIIAFISNWMVGLPIGATLAYHFEMGAKGLWLGLTIGLTLMAISLSVLYFKRVYPKF